MFVVVRLCDNRDPHIVQKLVINSYEEAIQKCLELRQVAPESGYTYHVRSLREPKVVGYRVVRVTCTPDPFLNFTRRDYETVGVYKTFRSAKDAYRSFDKDRAVDTYFTVEAVYK